MGFFPKLPPDRADDRNDGNGGTPRNERIAQPVQLLPAVEHDFKRGQADRHQRQPGAVDAQLLALVQQPRGRERGRIPQHHAREKGTQHAHRDVDVEDPAPGVVVGDPATQRWAEHRRAQDGHRVDRHGHPALFAWERIGKDGPHTRLQTTARKALQHAKDHQRCQGRRDAAGRGEHREHHDGDQVEVFAAQHGGDPAGDGQDDRVGHQVAGQHPGGLILRGRERAGDVRQRHVGDGGIEHLHKRAHGDDQGNDPGVEDALMRERSRT